MHRSTAATLEENGGCVSTINPCVLILWQITLSSQYINVKLGQCGKILLSKQSACSLSQQALKMYLLDSNAKQVGSKDNNVPGEAAV